jgi:ribulose-phosphate 3-epimerase
MVEILPSILAADFAHLEREIGRVSVPGVSMLHLDVMDGRFVPNISFGPVVVAAIRRTTNLHLDVHLMIEEPDRYIPDFAAAGASSILVHQEACPHLDRSLRLIQSHGCKAGVVLNPSTPVSTLEDVLGLVDYVLIMSVNPGFGGQKFIPRSLDKIRALAARRREMRLDFPIEIDGGIGAANVGEAVRAGAEWIVSGSAIFGAPDPAAAIREMQQAARGATAVRV